ncbi:hypothetical protein PTSG_03211 [Salpingoeca rosetta]|uniref:Pop1 N-terminal domain-containing protein n=1 Tax=Salpingoeca rosetta (strain ATCC 50818 / BSB-021) TaxID=946362 RepID=F2U4J3_SALR5|nr:uncharacterized protein PTSG_03211 [Salpingoeca rosetta]EGD82559.1 hypothetical protein PTSG_03211 [Salpingoeca rosetta]|eukprot:XP_004995795.1 hypothetical protein PTSG_03211 [Salpingoeca rosetta]
MERVPPPKQSGTAAKKSREKKRSRRNRRRPSNLNREYAKRSAHKTWLHTHIWHTKRFKMEALWGWRIPVHANEKSVRANYRWVKGAHCTMADMSYYSCFQLTGARSAVRAALGACLPYPHRIFDGREHHRLITRVQAAGAADNTASTGTADDNKATAGAHKHGELIGVVSVIATPWAPAPPTAEASSSSLSSSLSSLSSDSECSVWVWAHPSIAVDVHTAITTAATATSTTAAATTAAATTAAATTAAAQHGATTTPSTSTTSTGGRVKVEDMSGELCRFRLVGGASHALLVRALHVAVDGEEVQAQDDGNSTDNGDGDDGDRGVVKDKDDTGEGIVEDGGGGGECVHDGNDDDHDNDDDTAGGGGGGSEGVRQMNTSLDDGRADVAGVDAGTLRTRSDTAVWQSLRGMRDPSQLSAGAALCLTVWDPRLRSPSSIHPPDQHAVHTQDTDGDTQACLLEWITTSTASPLWSPTARAAINTSKLPQKMLDRRRSRVVGRVGGDLPPTTKDSLLPLLLIQRPGSTASRRASVFAGPGSGYACGWDVVLPSAWAREVWHCLVHAGAKTCGLRDVRQHATEQGMLGFPFDFVGTRAQHLWRAHTSTQDLSRCESAGCVTEVQAAGRGRLDCRTALFVPAAGDIEVAATNPLLLESSAALKGKGVFDFEFRGVAGGLTSGGFCHSRAREYGLGFVTVAALGECIRVTQQLRDTLGAPPGVPSQQTRRRKRQQQQQQQPRGDGASGVVAATGTGTPHPEKRQAGWRGKKRALLQHPRFDNTFLALSKHADTRSFRVVHLRVVDTHWLES